MLKNFQYVRQPQDIHGEGLGGRGIIPICNVDHDNQQLSNIQGAILKSFKFKQILKLSAQQIWMSFCLVVNLNLPDFILSIWRQIIQGSDVEPELFALREFAETGSKGN